MVSYLSSLLTSPSRLRDTLGLRALVLTMHVHQDYLEGLLEQRAGSCLQVMWLLMAQELHFEDNCFTERVSPAGRKHLFPPQPSSQLHLRFSSVSSLQRENLNFALTKAHRNCSLPAVSSASFLHLSLGVVRSVPTSLTFGVSSLSFCLA